MIDPAIWYRSALGPISEGPGSRRFRQRRAPDPKATVGRPLETGFSYLVAPSCLG